MLILAMPVPGTKISCRFWYWKRSAGVAAVESIPSDPVSTLSVPSATSAMDVVPKGGTVKAAGGNWRGRAGEHHAGRDECAGWHPSGCAAGDCSGSCRRRSNAPAERAALAEKGRCGWLLQRRPVGECRRRGEKLPRIVERRRPAKNRHWCRWRRRFRFPDQPVVPAKLLRAAQPIYPPDAMRNYITGDVRIEAEVDKRGQIGAMKILLGPKQFRQVAMDALKQYEYALATQGGKPVASKVTVTIKFWFDP